MKYWHPHLPFGQHISVSTLVIYKKNQFWQPFNNSSQQNIILMVFCCFRQDFHCFVFNDEILILRQDSVDPLNSWTFHINMLVMTCISVFNSPDPLRVTRTITIWSLGICSCDPKTFTFYSFPSQPVGQLEQHLAGIFIGWSSTNFFVDFFQSIFQPILMI